MLTEITYLLILADSLKIRRIIRYGGTRLEICSGKCVCLISEVAERAVVFKRSLLLSSFVMRWALEYDKLSPWIKAWPERCASTLIVCDPSNLHIAFRLNLMDRYCNRVRMPLDSPHSTKNGVFPRVGITFPIYFNVFIIRDFFFSQLTPRSRDLHGELIFSQSIK
jgi:hypothetical protein